MNERLQAAGRSADRQGVLSGRARPTWRLGRERAPPDRPGTFSLPLSLSFSPRVARPLALPVRRGSPLPAAPADTRQTRLGARPGPRSSAAVSPRPRAPPPPAAGQGEASWRARRQRGPEASRTGRPARGPSAGAGRGRRGPPSFLPGRGLAGPLRPDPQWPAGPPGREVSAPDPGSPSECGRRGEHGVRGGAQGIWIRGRVRNGGGFGGERALDPHIGVRGVIALCGVGGCARSPDGRLGSCRVGAPCAADEGL